MLREPAGNSAAMFGSSLGAQFAALGEQLATALGSLRCRGAMQCFSGSDRVLAQRRRQPRAVECRRRRRRRMPAAGAQHEHRADRDRGHDTTGQHARSAPVPVRRRCVLDARRRVCGRGWRDAATRRRDVVIESRCGQCGRIVAVEAHRDLTVVVWL
jgi:hypothetical protein